MSFHQSSRVTTKKPPVFENKLNNSYHNITQISIPLNNSQSFEKIDNAPHNNRSRSLAALQDISNLKFATPNKKDFTLPTQGQSETYLKEIMFLTTKIQDLTQRTIQIDKDTQLDVVIEKEKLRKSVIVKDEEIDQLLHQLRLMETQDKQKQQNIGELVFELNQLDAKAVHLALENNELHKQSEQMQQLIEETNHQLEEQIQTIQQYSNEIEEKTRNEQQQWQQIKNLQQENQELNESQQQMNYALNDLTEKFNQIQTIRDQLADANQNLKIQVSQEIQRADEFMNEFARSQEREEESRQELATWINKFQHLDRGHQSHLEEMRKQLELERRSTIDIEMNKLHQKFQLDAQALDQRLRQEQQNSHTLEQHLLASQEEKESLLDELRNKDMDIDEMNVQIETLQKIELDNRKMAAHIQFLEQKLENIVQDGQRARHFSEDYRQKFGQKERQLQDQLSRVSTERDHIDMLLKYIIGQQKLKKRKQTKENESIKQHNQEIMSDLHQVQSELQSFRVQYEEMQTHVKLLQEDVKNLQVYRQRYHEIQQNIDKRDDTRQQILQEQHLNLKQDYQNLQTSYSQLKQHVASQSSYSQEAKLLQQEIMKKDNLVRELESKIRFYMEENNRLINH